MNEQRKYRRAANSPCKCAKGYEVAFLGETYLLEANTTDYYTPTHRRDAGNRIAGGGQTEKKKKRYENENQTLIQHE